MRQPLHDRALAVRAVGEPVVAVDHARRVSGGSAAAFFDFEFATTGWTSLANVTGWSAISLPLGATSDGLPIGVQVIAAPGREDLALRVAAELESSGVCAAPVAGEGIL